MKNDKHEHEPEVDIEPTDEDNIDEPLIEDIENHSQSKIKKLQAKLKACESQRTQLQDDLQRAKADFLNARKRLEEDRVRDSERITTKHIEKLLPLSDSFHMAMSNAEAWNSVDPVWRKGVEAIHNQLQRLLASYDVKEFSPQGEKFDPTLHEAMAEVPVTDPSQDHAVVMVMQNGFVREINGKTELIRPARVSVGILDK